MLLGAVYESGKFRSQEANLVEPGAKPVTQMTNKLPDSEKHA